MTPEWPLTARSRVQYHPKTSSEGVKEQVVRGPGVRLRKRKRTDEACCQGGVLAMAPPNSLGNSMVTYPAVGRDQTGIFRNLKTSGCDGEGMTLRGRIL